MTTVELEHSHTEHPIIAIEGPIGAGKSTLCRWLRRYHGASVTDEAQSDLLPAYFREPRRYAFTVQVDSLTQRHRVLKSCWWTCAFASRWLDRSVFGDYAFAKANHTVGRIDAQEYALYRALYETLSDAVSPPHAVLWLDVPVEICTERIARRGTVGEVIPRDYAEALINAYDEVLRDAESRGVYVHREDWSKDLRDKGLYHAHADAALSRFHRNIQDRMCRT